MKKQKLIWASLPITLAMLLAGCGSRTPSNSPDQSGDSSSQGDKMQHRPGYVKGLPDNAVTRKFDAEFDTMLDDFSAATINGNTDGTIHDGYLSAVVDSEDVNFPTNDSKSIYKMAAGAFGPATSITFKMRVVEGELPLENLILAMRGNDDVPLYEIPLNEALNEDAEPLPALTNEFQDMTIDLLSTIEDAETTYGESDVVVLNEQVGFHLYAANKEVSSLIEIASINRTSAGVSALVDDFSRLDFSKPNNMGSWWCDSASGYIVRHGLALEGNKAYTTPALTTEQKGETQLVLDINGDTTGTAIVPVKGSSEGTAVSWADLKDKDGNAVVSAASGVYGPLAIDLEKSGLAGEDVTAYRVTSTSKIELDQVFLSSFGAPAEKIAAPILDTENAVVFDNFNRTRSSAQIPTAWTLDDDADLNGWVSYKNSAALSMDGNNLVFAPKGDSDYTELTLGTKHLVGGHRYLVFEIKASAADIDTFRVEIGSNPAIWLNSSLAAKGLTSKEAASSYPTKDGYSWYVIDLSQHEVEMGDLINIYAGNSEELLVNSIFVANDKLDLAADPTAACGISRDEELDLANYAAIAWGSQVKSRYLALRLDATEAPVDSIRLELGATKWFHDGLTAINGKTGAAVKNGDVLDGEGIVLVFDLKEHEFTIDGTANLTVHAGGEFTGKITLKGVNLLIEGHSNEFQIGDASTVTLTVDEGKDYVYGGWVYTQYAGARALRMKIAGDGVSTFGSFRFELSTGVYAVNAGKLIATLDDGSVLGADDIIPTAGEFVTLTLADGGLFEIGFHTHYGDASMGGHSVTLSNFTAFFDHSPYQLVVDSYSDIL